MRLLLFNLATDMDDPILGFTTRWIWALAKRVEFIRIITMRTGRVSVPNNVRIYSAGKEKGYSEPRRAIEFYRYLFHVLREDHIDVCFSHMMPIFTVLAAPALRLKGIPIITWYAHRQVTAILKLAHHLSQQIVSINKGSYPYTHDRFLSLGHGIDTDVFSPANSSPDDPPFILSVGRLSPIKSFSTLIEAMPPLLQHACCVRCTLVGDAPERDRPYVETLRQRVQALGLEDSVQFAGAMPNGQVVHWYQRCFAHVNLCPTGALDKVALEAMACGKLSLVANEEFRETMGDWADWLIFRHGDAGDLARKLIALLELSSAEREKIGLYLRERVLQMHSLERLGDRLIGVLQRIIQ
jgi:glycosyltransferase involved in cell wall biosynthesis